MGWTVSKFDRLLDPIGIVEVKAKCFRGKIKMQRHNASSMKHKYAANTVAITIVMS